MRLHAASLHYFDRVRRVGSIREAARQLNVSSSAVNRQILKLEEEIGAPLFERLPRGVRLTAAGEALSRHVIVTLQDFERFRSDMAGLKGLRTGHVGIAAAEGLCSTVLPNALAAMARQAPGITTRVHRVGSLSVPDLVASDECDVGLAFDLDRDGRLAEVQRIEDRIGAVVAPTHPLAEHATVPLSACLDYTLLLPERDLTIDELLAPAFIALRAEPRHIVRSNSIELLREMAERGMGIAFQTRVGLDRALTEGRLRHIPVTTPGPMLSYVQVVTRAQRALPMAVSLFLEILRPELARLE